MGDHEIADSIQVRHLQVPIEDALVLRHDEPSLEAAGRLSERNFDRAPVVTDGRVIGVAERTQLQAAAGSFVGEAYDRLDSSLLVSADAPVARLLGWLATSEFLFVLDGHDITGLVTSGDLNKQPGRTYFFLLLSDVEMRLADLVRRRYAASPAEPLALLVPARATTVRDRHAAAQQADREPDYVAYFDLADLLRVVKNDRTLLVTMQMHSQAAWKHLTGSFPELRNAVVHGVRDLVDEERGPSELLRDVDRLHETLARAMVADAALREHLPGPARAHPLSHGTAGLRVAGVDGCRRGWVVATELQTGEVTLELVRTVSELLALPLDLIAIDMPIGLRDVPPGGRPVDSAARAYIGARRSSVFAAPARSAFGLRGWDDLDRPAHGLSRQTLAIAPKIREVDEVMTPARQWRGEPAGQVPALAEVHPEVSFTELNGGIPLEYAKKQAEGRRMRTDLLGSVFPSVDELVAARPLGVTPDDALDALVALWSARRIASGRAVRLGGDLDGRALEMTIWA